MVEVSIESDFNPGWAIGKAVHEPHSEWDHLGKDPFGQPSILYRTPFKLDTAAHVATTKDYAGYGDWQGQSGTINPPDSTISQSGGGIEVQSCASRGTAFHLFVPGAAAMKGVRVMAVSSGGLGGPPRVKASGRRGGFCNRFD